MKNRFSTIVVMAMFLSLMPYSFFLLVNRYFDRSADTHQVTVVDSMDVHTNRKHIIPRFKVFLKIDMGKQRTYVMDVNALKFSTLHDGEKVDIAIRKGALGFAWIESITPAS